MSWKYEAGDVYLNEGKYLARCVVAAGNGIVYFTLSWPPSKLSDAYGVNKLHLPGFKRWCKHQATPEEIEALPIPLADLQLYALQKFQEVIDKKTAYHLSIASTEELQAELASRFTQEVDET